MWKFFLTCSLLLVFKLVVNGVHNEYWIWYLFGSLLTLTAAAVAKAHEDDKIHGDTSTVDAFKLWLLFKSLSGWWILPLGILLMVLSK